MRDRRRAIAEKSERQVSSGRQRLLVHREAKQRGLHFVIRLVGQHGLHPRMARQRLRRRCRELHEQRVVRNVGNNFAARARDGRAKASVNRAARLHDECARLRRRLQVRRDFQIQFRPRVNERVLEQDGVAVSG